MDSNYYRLKLPLGDRLKQVDWRRHASMAAFIGVPAVGLSAIIAGTHIAHNVTHDLYEQSYTDTGRCLDGSRYDIEQGARYDDSIDNGIESLIVKPDHARFGEPKTLEFIVTNAAGGLALEAVGASANYIHMYCGDQQSRQNQ